MKRVVRPVMLVTLALLWIGLQGTFTVGEFVWGLLMGLIVLVVFPGPLDVHRQLRYKSVGDFVVWLWAALRLFGYFLWELLKADILLARLVLRPRIREEMKPGIIGMRLTGNGAGQISILATMITLTPGTVAIGLSDDREWLYIHSIDASDEEGALEAAYKFEQMIMEVLR